MTERRNLWDAIPVLDSVSGGVWNRIDKDAAARTAAPSSFDVLSQATAAYAPGGVWDDVEDETLLLRPEELGVWYRLERAVATRRPTTGPDVWEDIEDETLIVGGAVDVWQETSDETLLLQRTGFNIWGRVRPRDVANYTPRPTSDWALKALTDTHKQSYSVLKNTRTGAYLRLTPEQRFLWEHIDGQNTVKDITLAYVLQYKTLDVSGLLDFMRQLGAYNFLEDPGVDVYASMDDSLARRRAAYRVRRGLARLLEIEIAWYGIDRWISHLHRLIGPFLFHRVTQAILFIVAIAGLVAFVYLALFGGYSALRDFSQLPVWGLVSLYLMFAVVVLIHELAHAITLKHFKREVRRGGFILYYGFPGWFVDTSDVWLSPRRARILVSWAGPYSGLVLAGLCSLLVLFATPDPLIGGLLFTAALSANLVSLQQLNPLLAYDGYYMLIDWLEMPRLGQRARAFVRRDLWRKLRTREALNREERIFAIFGALSLAWTVVALWMMLVFLQGVLTSAIGALAAPLAGQ